MKWNIAFSNGKIMAEGNDEFLPNGFNKIYITDGINGYGFYKDGTFFLNNKIFNFKIDSNGYDLEPFQFKTGMLTLGQGNQCNELCAWNVGYWLRGSNDSQKYILTISKDKFIYFYAERYDLKGNKTASRQLRLR